MNPDEQTVEIAQEAARLKSEEIVKQTFAKHDAEKATQAAEKAARTTNKLFIHIYDVKGALVARVTNCYDAAVLTYSKGRIARLGARGKVIWSEGYEGFCSSESYDKAAGIMWGRIPNYRQKE